MLRSLIAIGIGPGGSPKRTFVPEPSRFEAVHRHSVKARRRVDRRRAAERDRERPRVRVPDLGREGTALARRLPVVRGHPTVGGAFVHGLGVAEEARRKLKQEASQLHVLLGLGRVVHTSVERRRGYPAPACVGPGAGNRVVYEVEELKGVRAGHVRLGERHVRPDVPSHAADHDPGAIGETVWLERRDHDRGRVRATDDVRDRIAEPEQKVDVRVAAGLRRGRVQVELVDLLGPERRLLRDDGGGHRKRHDQRGDKQERLRSTRLHRTTSSTSEPGSSGSRTA